MSWALSFVDPRPGRALAENETPASTSTLPLEGTDNFWASWNADQATRRSGSWDRTMRPRAEAALSGLADATGDESLLPKLDRFGAFGEAGANLPTSGGVVRWSADELERRLDQNESRILELKPSHPNLRTLAELRDEAAGEVHDVEDRAARAHGPLSFLGGLASGVTDPVNLVAAPFMAERGAWWMTKLALAAAGNAAAQAAVEPSVYALRRELKLPQTLGDSVAAIGEAAVAGAVLEGGVMAARAGMRIVPSAVAKAYRSVGDALGRVPKAEAAVDVIEDLDAVLKTHPAAETPVGADTHRLAMQRATDAVLEDRMPEALPDPDVAVVQDALEQNRVTGAGDGPTVRTVGEIADEHVRQMTARGEDPFHVFQPIRDEQGIEYDFRADPATREQVLLERTPAGQWREFGRVPAADPETGIIDDQELADLVGEMETRSKLWAERKGTPNAWDAGIDNAKIVGTEGVHLTSADVLAIGEGRMTASELDETIRDLEKAPGTDPMRDAYLEDLRQQRTERRGMANGEQPATLDELERAIDRLEHYDLTATEEWHDYGGAERMDLNAALDQLRAVRDSLLRQQEDDHLARTVEEGVIVSPAEATPRQIADVYTDGVERGRVTARPEVDAAVERIRARRAEPVTEGEVVPQRPTPAQTEQLAGRVHDIMEANPERQMVSGVFDEKGKPLMQTAREAFDSVDREEVALRSVIECMLPGGE